jgi:hypothetical protein
MQPNPISQFLTTEKRRLNMIFLGQVNSRQERLCYFNLFYDRLIYLMLHGLIMDGYNSVNITSLLLLYIFVNIIHIWTIFTAEHVLTRMVTSSNALLRFTLYYLF